MASDIDTGINRDFPIAGQDNDTQGFRDNFSVIQSSFVAAKTEIETLQDETAKTTSSNSFNNFNIVDANLINVTNQGVLGQIDGFERHNIEFGTNGYTHFLKLSSDKEIQLSGFPNTSDEQGYCKTGTLNIFLDNTADTAEQRLITFTRSANEFSSSDNFYLGTGFTDSSYTIEAGEMILIRVDFIITSERTIFIKEEENYTKGNVNINV